MTWAEAGEISKALLTPMIAAVGALIAWQQSRTARRQADTAHRKLKLDLYDRRYRAFSLVREAFVLVITRADISIEEYYKFSLGSVEGGFLFDKSVTQFVIEVEHRLHALMQVNDSLRALVNQPPSPESKQLAQDKAVLLKWFNDTIPRLTEMYYPYLGFHQVL